MLLFLGTGNVLKIQSLLHVCSEYHKLKEGDEAEPEGVESEGATPTTKSGSAKTKSASKDKLKKSDSKSKKEAEEAEPGSLDEPGSHQSISVLGIALIAMGEDIGGEMAMRTFNHLV